MGGPGSGRRKARPEARCLEHPGSVVVAVGSYSTKSGRRQRYRCTPSVGDQHTFVVGVDPPVRKRAIALWSPPPECPEHPGSKVVRNGRYAKSTAKMRQRYRCTPADGSKRHSFTPPLPRDHVHAGEEHCDHCEELRGVHRGETAVARRHTWSTRIVARGLEQLAAGSSYADVGRWALRASGTKRTRKPAPKPAGTPKRKRSKASAESRNAWHIAADWVEAFGPAVFDPVEERLRAVAYSERARLDALVAAGQPLDRPQVVLLDDVPVYGQELDSTRARRDAGYFLLIVAEVSWATSDDDPFGVPPPPSLNLRLVRAMAKSNTASWRLMFDELGYAPDFIVADAGTGIAAAIDAHFDPTHTKFVPSLWHLARKVENALAATRGAVVAGPHGRELIRPLAEHLRRLSRSSGVLDSTAAWATWWDELCTILVAHRLPVDETLRRRRVYEPQLAAVLDDINAHPQMPVSTGGLETLISKHVQPLLSMRRTAFANLERTNRLFDLVVARQNGAFDNLTDVVRLLRDDTSSHNGYTVPLRAISDPRPVAGSYSSLRDSTLLNNIAKKRGLT